MNRRQLLKLLPIATAMAARPSWAAPTHTAAYKLVAYTDRARILKAAAQYLALQPATITSFPSDRSPGGPHDYFSDSDYFWPDPKNPNGPFINRDGQSYPGLFRGHRKAMIALSIQMPALTAAWLLTRRPEYAQRACDHLRAWFVTPATRMNPNLEFSQGVRNLYTGRSFGIIDTLHLVEVARAATLLAPSPAAPGMLSPADDTAVKDWFRSYLAWIKTSEKGIKERDALNNHAMCWALQAAEYARLLADTETREELRKQYIDVLLPNQMGADGSFPKELARTKPYSYSIFNFDVMAALCQSLKGTGAGPASVNDLLTFQLPDSRGLCKAASFLYPYLKDKAAWPYAKDVEHFDSLPVRSPGLLFAGLACNQKPYIALWKTLNPDPDNEIIRNYPVRQPLLWV